MSDEMLDILRPFLEMASRLGADEVELFAQRSNEKTVNFQTSALNSAAGSILEGVGIRVLIKKSLGFISVNSLDPAKIETSLHDAISIAKVTPPEDFHSLPSPSEISDIPGLYDPKVDQISMEEVLEKSKQLLEDATSFDERISVDSGTFYAGSTEYAVINSKGLEASDKRTSLQSFIFGMAIDGDDIGSFDYEFESVTQLKDADMGSIAQSFGKKVLRNLGAVKMESFAGSAIMTPDALSDLLGVLIESAKANQIQTGSSYLADRLGQEIAVNSFSIIDDGTQEAAAGSGAFDREGVPHQKHPIVQNGVFKGILYDTFTSNKDGLESTGHASGTFRGMPNISQTNIDVLPGDSSLDEMIREVKHGILIPRISAFPDTVSGNFTGPIKGGQLIKNGQIECTLKETMITGNLFEALMNITSISKERKPIRYQSTTFMLPYIQMDGMKYAA